MSTPPQADTPGTPISAETERILHDFVRHTVSRLSEIVRDSIPEFEDDARWERGTDGHFRERKKRMRRLWPILSEEWLRSLPDYQPCLERLKSDVVVGPHLDRLVGTSMSGFRLEASNIVMSLLYAMLDDEGCLAFTDECFLSEWTEWVGFFTADRIAVKTVAPLPNLVVPAFPLRLNDELVLDRLTDDEVTRCYQGGVIRPYPRSFPLIYGESAVGIRRTLFLPKLIRRGDETNAPLAAGEGSFGNRPLLRDDLVVDDVLSAMRLFKSTQIRTAGLVSWTDSPWMITATSVRVLGWWPHGGKFELAEGEVPRFLKLWCTLEEGAADLAFSIRRFNLAFDRELLDDRIVDLVIAAEALFLSDLGKQDRGEIRFRFALRAAKFIKHPNHSEQDIFRIMRQAYGARSAIVHGGSPQETHLPDNKSASLQTFIDAIEELVRLGLCKALLMKEERKQMRQAAYWDDLLLSQGPKPKLFMRQGRGLLYGRAISMPNFRSWPIPASLVGSFFCCVKGNVTLSGSRMACSFLSRS